MQKRMHHLKEAFIATCLIMIITALVSLIPLKNEFLRAIRQDVYGFDIYDLYYSGKHDSTYLRDTNIVIVQLAHGRAAIAEQIVTIKKCNPRVLGIDAIFLDPGDSTDDKLLRDAIEDRERVVFASKLEKTESTKRIIHNFFDEHEKNSSSGYGNFLANEYDVIRTYAPFLEINGVTEYAFSSRIAEKFNFERFNKLKKRSNKLEVINYFGNIPESFHTIRKDDLGLLFSDGQLANILSGKIVLLGEFTIYEPRVLNDLHFSPLNSQLAGKSFPDMYGVVIHANILSMILNGNYVALASDLIGYLAAFIITFLFLYYIINLYSHRTHPSHGKILLFQFLLILFMLYFFVQVFNFLHWKIPLGPLLVSLVLCVELLGLYKMLALWFHKIFRYKTVFTHK